MRPSTHEKENVVVPVSYKRLGLYCYDFEFRQDVKVVTVDYKLVRRARGWKVDAPLPNYPDISPDVLIRELTALGANVNETADRRKLAEITARNIKAALVGQ